MGKTNISSNILVALEQFKIDALEAMERLEYEEAITILKKGLRLKGDSVEHLDLLGACFMQINEPEQAKTIFSKSIQLQPKKGYQKYMYVGELTEGKESLKYLKQGMQMLVQMRDSKDPTLSLEDYASTIAEGFCSIAELYMTDLCFEEDAEKVCEDVLSRACKEDPNQQNVTVLQTLANLRLVQQNLKEAQSLVIKIMDLYKKGAQVNYEYKISSCKLAIECGFYAEAEYLLKALIEESDDVVDVWYLAGLTAKFKKDFSSATEHFKRAYQLGTEQEEATEFMAQLDKEIQFCSKQKDDFVIEKDDEIDEEFNEEDFLSGDEDVMDEMN
jgi:tetratricopeptide (TPR) repeat protein